MFPQSLLVVDGEPSSGCYGNAILIPTNHGVDGEANEAREATIQ